MTRKLYSGPFLNVSFDGAVCRHAAECVRGVPAVFETSRRPCIDPDVADTEALANQLREVSGLSPGAFRVEQLIPEKGDVSQL
jgi:uncharacterized Fe-S cluster protein YjdI